MNRNFIGIITICFTLALVSHVGDEETELAAALAMSMSRQTSAQSTHSETPALSDAELAASLFQEQLKEANQMQGSWVCGTCTFLNTDTGATRCGMDHLGVWYHLKLHFPFFCVGLVFISVLRCM